MRNKGVHMENRLKNFIDQSDNAVKLKALEDEIQRLKMLVSKIAESMSWGNSVVKVVFRDESFSEKYKSKVESFFKDILDKGENCIVNSQIYDLTEQEFLKLQHSFQAEKPSKRFNGNKASPDSIPFYSSEYEDILHCDEAEDDEQADEDKPQTMTCFNCLGDHHMKQCREKIDRTRIANNKKELMQANSSRYHEEERKNAVKPGNLSSELRLALGLKSDQLPHYIYKMRVIGYPPGWMDEAVFETSGLSLYDCEGKAVSGNASSDLLEDGIKYDSAKFVEYPGFNTPVLDGFKDEWKSLGMLPIQSHHQLSKILNSDNTIDSNNMYKRKTESTTSDEEAKKVRNAGSNDIDSSSPERWSPENSSTPIKQDSCLKNSHNNTLLEKSMSVSLSQSPGTPILAQGNQYKKLPAADKFAEGITDHLNFENLPESTGTYEKMRGILFDVQKKLHSIKKGS